MKKLFRKLADWLFWKLTELPYSKIKWKIILCIYRHGPRNQEITDNEK